MSTSSPTRALRLRPATPEDEAFLFELFAESQARELAPLRAQQVALWRSLVEMQFRGRRMSYAAQHPRAEDQMLCLEDGKAIGRLLLERGAVAWRVVDIAVLDAFRGQGWGSSMLEQCQQECAEAGAELRLSVMHGSPARRIYERLGFRETGQDALAAEMVWTPPVAVQPAKSSRLAVVALALLALLCNSTAHAQSTPQNGVEATSVPLSLPGGMAYDSNGNLYIAATNDQVIRMVNTAGIIATVAGTGSQGFSGDGGAATSAQLDSPVGVAIDASNNLYIADTHNNRIREVVAATGVITTIAGTGAAGFSGDGGAATAAVLNYPTALGFDSSGNLYIADTNNHRIRKISGGTISTVAGNGDQAYEGDGVLATATGLDSPNGVALDASSNIYIGDTHNQRVRLVTATTGIISTYVGTGVKTYSGDGGAPGSAALARPRGVAVAPNGTILIADSDNERVRAVSAGAINTVAGNGTQGFSGDTSTATSASLDTPRAVTATAQSNVVVADSENNRVREVVNGTINTIAGVAPTKSESLIESGPLTSSVYGTSVTITATFSFGSNTASGTVTFYDGLGTGPAQVGTGTLSGNTASFTTAALTAGVHNIIAVYPGDTNDPAITSGNYVVIVTQASSKTVLTTNNAAPVLGTSVTLTATITDASTGSTGTPTGSVSFYDGTTLLNSTPATVTAGVATLTLTTLPVGAQSLTAIYSGDTNFITSTSNTLGESVTAPGFTITPSPATQTALPGATSSYTLTLTPSNPTFLNAVTLSASGLPSGATATFTPSSIAAGSGTSTSVMAITTPAAAAKLTRPARGLISSTALALLMLPLAFNRRVRRSARKLARVLTVLLLLVAAGALAGCGAGGFFSQATTSYTITVTAVSGSITQTTTVTLTVQ